MTTVITDTGAAHTVTLRSPFLGDERHINLHAVYRRSRSSLIFGYKRTPETQTLRLRYADMNRQTINLLRAFQIAAIRPVIITLDNGDQWQGDIMNDFKSAHVGNINSPFELIFEGVKIA